MDSKIISPIIVLVKLSMYNNVTQMLLVKTKVFVCLILNI